MKKKDWYVTPIQRSRSSDCAVGVIPLILTEKRDLTVLLGKTSTLNLKEHNALCSTDTGGIVSVWLQPTPHRSSFICSDTTASADRLEHVSPNESGYFTSACQIVDC